MNTQKGNENHDVTETQAEESGVSRREFIKRSSIYAAATPIALAALMSPTNSYADSDGGGHDGH